MITTMAKITISIITIIWAVIIIVLTRKIIDKYNNDMTADNNNTKKIWYRDTMSAFSALQSTDPWDTLITKIQLNAVKKYNPCHRLNPIFFFKKESLFVQ